jgi:hypothetical protein
MKHISLSKIKMTHIWTFSLLNAAIADRDRKWRISLWWDEAELSNDVVPAWPRFTHPLNIRLETI